MRIFFALLSFLFFTSQVQGQLNSRLLGNLSYAQELNDIWGYAAPDGTEYALVGTTSGVSIVRLSDPANPEEVQFVAGENSVWRDLKTFGDYVYVTTDQSRTTEGLLVIDLSGLPDEVSSFNWRPEIGEGDTLKTCHNIYIDEFGVAYLAGCNINRGGMILVDVAAKAGQPQLIGLAPDIYAHDVYAQDNRMFASELNEGRFSVYDVSDKDNIRLLGSSETPFRFTHNAWASTDGQYVFTTDERSNAPVASYDISDFDNIRELDQYRPISSLNQGVIPHNVHVIDDFLAISYYTEGARIVDISRPDNLVETAYFDTNDDFATGFHGAWGLYPYLPSGRLLISDIENGLFVVDVDYVKAAYLEGIVSDFGTGLAIEEVDIQIIADQDNEATTDREGNYRTGLGLSGSFEVVFKHPRYREQRVQVTLVSGEVTPLNVQLEPKSLFQISGLIITQDESNPVPGAKVVVRNDEFIFEAEADAAGRFLLEDIYEGTYDITAGSWGFFHQQSTDILLDENASVTLTLEPGYQDDFIFDLGWASTGSASSGFWERGIPDGIPVGQNQFATPPADIDSDFGNTSYVTGNGGGNPGDDDIDNGDVLLTSPVFDLSTYDSPVLSYYLWFYNNFGPNPANDSLIVNLTNGNETIELEVITQSQTQWREQSTFVLSDLIELTSKMQLIVKSADRPETGNVVEAGFDVFLIKEGNSTAVGDPFAEKVTVKAYPNPFQSQLTIEYAFPETPSARAFFRVFNTLGQEVERIGIEAQNGSIEIGNRLENGVYFIITEMDRQRVNTVKVLKF